MSKVTFIFVVLFLGAPAQANPPCHSITELLAQKNNEKLMEAIDAYREALMDHKGKKLLWLQQLEDSGTNRAWLQDPLVPINYESSLWKLRSSEVDFMEALKEHLAAEEIQVQQQSDYQLEIDPSSVARFFPSLAKTNKRVVFSLTHLDWENTTATGVYNSSQKAQQRDPKILYLDLKTLLTTSPSPEVIQSALHYWYERYLTKQKLYYDPDRLQLQNTSREEIRLKLSKLNNKVVEEAALWVKSQGLDCQIVDYRGETALEISGGEGNRLGNHAASLNKKEIRFIFSLPHLLREQTVSGGLAFPDATATNIDTILKLEPGRIEFHEKLHHHTNIARKSGEPNIYDIELDAIPDKSFPVPSLYQKHIRMDEIPAHAIDLSYAAVKLRNRLPKDLKTAPPFQKNTEIENQLYNVKFALDTFQPLTLFSLQACQEIAKTRRQVMLDWRNNPSRFWNMDDVTVDSIVNRPEFLLYAFDHEPPFPYFAPRGLRFFHEDESPVEKYSFNGSLANVTVAAAHFGILGGREREEAFDKRLETLIQLLTSVSKKQERIRKKIENPENWEDIQEIVKLTAEIQAETYRHMNIGKTPGK